ncbi:MAG: hypothetical protein AB1473_01945 [Thermodesulfobacteriota bacterium]
MIAKNNGCTFSSSSDKLFWLRLLSCLSLALFLSILLYGLPALAQEEEITIPKAPVPAADPADRFFDIKIPPGFEPIQSDDAGILKWRKGPAEIYLVVGDNLSKSSKKVYDELFQAAKNNKKIEKVEAIRVRGGKAFLYKEQPPGDETKARLWRLFVITDQKIINVDFVAPRKDFETYSRDFDATLKSFKLKDS